MTFLLDVNVLIALIDPAHVQHDAAHAWFVARGRQSWATSPLTENGVMRAWGNFVGAWHWTLGQKQAYPTESALDYDGKLVA